MQIKIPDHLTHCFEQAGHLHTYQPSQAIYLQGDQGNDIYFIRKGRVRAFYITSTGKELTFEIIEKGRIFGESSFLSQCVRPVSVNAVTEVELLVCDLHHLYTYMAESEELMRIMLQLLSNTCNHLTQQLRRVTLYDRYQKIASLLLSETKRPDQDRGVTTCSIPYTHEDVAMILGMNRVTVNKVLNEWKKNGYISISYGHITILQRGALERLFPMQAL